MKHALGIAIGLLILSTLTGYLALNHAQDLERRVETAEQAIERLDVNMAIIQTKQDVILMLVVGILIGVGVLLVERWVTRAGLSRERRRNGGTDYQTPPSKA